MHNYPDFSAGLIKKHQIFDAVKKMPQTLNTFLSLHVEGVGAWKALIIPLSKGSRGFL